MTVAQSGERDGLLQTVADEHQAPDVIRFNSRTGRIHSDLTIGAAVVDAQPLKANDKVASNGCALNGAGFILDGDAAKALCAGTDAMCLVIKPYRNGRDLTAKPRQAYVIDLYGYEEGEVERRWPAIYQHVALTVRPAREARKDRTADAAQYAALWCGVPEASTRASPSSSRTSPICSYR